MFAVAGRSVTVLEIPRLAFKSRKSHDRDAQFSRILKVPCYVVSILYVLLVERFRQPARAREPLQNMALPRASELAGELGAIRVQCFLNSAIRHQPHQRCRHV